MGVYIQPASFYGRHVARFGLLWASKRNGRVTINEKLEKVISWIQQGTFGANEGWSPRP